MIVLRLRQSAKARSLISIRVADNVIEDSKIELLNADRPIFVVPVGIVILYNAEL
jgi:hypothetical protein